MWPCQNTVLTSQHEVLCFLNIESTSLRDVLSCLTNVMSCLNIILTSQYNMLSRLTCIMYCLKSTMLKSYILFCLFCVTKIGCMSDK